MTPLQRFTRIEALAGSVRRERLSRAREQETRRRMEKGGGAEAPPPSNSPGLKTRRKTPFRLKAEATRFRPA
jgi:hypothetical protein